MGPIHTPRAATPTPDDNEPWANLPYHREHLPAMLG